MTAIAKFVIKDKETFNITKKTPTGFHFIKFISPRPEEP